jgi:hypothetical protein
MNQLAVPLMLLVWLGSSVAIAADWVPIAKNEEDGYVLYMDKANLIQEGAIRKAWFLFDFDKPRLTLDTKETYRSVKELNYLNCADMTKASVTQQIYPERMGGGKPAAGFSVEEKNISYEEVIPGVGNGEIKLSGVCGKAPH